MPRPLVALLAPALALCLAPWTAVPARAATDPVDALALVPASEPAAPAELALLGELSDALPDDGAEGTREDVALLEIESPALSLGLALEPWELVAGIDGRPDAATRAAWRAAFGTGTPTSWRGTVAGRDDDSWARLLEVDGAWSGHVSVGGTLWRVDPVRDAAGGVPGHAVRRVAVADPEAIGAIGADAAGGTRTDGPEVLRIGIVVDSRFDERHGGRGLERALAIVNGVDGLFREGLGVGLAIDAVRVHGDPAADPLLAGGDTVETMLERFRLVRAADPELAGELALVHLFTGLDDARGAIGLGYVDGVCRDGGWATGLSTPFAFDMLLAAHEIAHVIGAPHDDDPSCAGLADGQDLMGPTLSAASRPTFSACSVEAVRRTLDSGCLVDGLTAFAR